MKRYEMGSVATNLETSSVGMLFTSPGVIKSVMEWLEPSFISEWYDEPSVQADQMVHSISLSKWERVLPLTWYIYGFLCDEGWEPYAHYEIPFSGSHTNCTHYFRREHEAPWDRDQ